MDIEARVRRAEELFHEGYNCSQSVVLAFADLTGVDEAMLEKISIGLGGGVGRLREVCGAVSGMAMVAGFICDRCGCGDGSASGGSAGVADSDGSGDGVSVGGVSGGGVSVGGVSGGGVSAGSLRTDAGARRAEQKKLAYSLVQELAGKFREENGSIVCHDLLNLRVNAAKAAKDGKASGVDSAAGTSGTDGVAGTDGGVVSSAGIGVPDAVGTDGGTMSGGLAGPSAYSPVPQERNDAYYKARPCQKLVGCSARIIAEYIAKNY
ncbi:MAG: C-GCAxxG-C-C family protein [Candidatus Cryptobacteroides sp.]